MPEAILTLRAIDEGDLAIALPDLGLPTHRSLAREIQIRLIALGILDPPDDGLFGPVSRLALRVFQQLAKLPTGKVINRGFARALLGASPLPDLTPGGDLAGRIVRAMLARGHWIARAPGYRNIVYVERINADGTLNANKPNQFNDLRTVITIDGKGRPHLVGSWQATTEPGTYYTKNGISDYAKKYGAARIAFGQYKAWRQGLHLKDHSALLQTEELAVYRDKNQDGSRAGDKLDVGASFGINQHWGYDQPSDDIGKASAGCLVGRTRKGHVEFMAQVLADPRYQANAGYLFLTTILDGATLPA